MFRIAALLLIASLPSASYAETIYGSWQGFLIETRQETINGVAMQTVTTGPVPFTLTMQWTSSGGFGSVTFDYSSPVPFSMLGTDSDPFGLQSASIFAESQKQGIGGYVQSATFDASYSHLDQTGFIPDGSATAVFSYSGAYPGFVGVPNSPMYTDVGTFTSAPSGPSAVPEPTSFAMLLVGVTGLIVYSRGLQ